MHVECLELPLTTLADDAAIVRDAVARAKAAGAKVLLAGHSYGGFVITEGGHDADLLLYCAASLPDSGESANSQFALIETPELAHAVELSNDGDWLSIDPERGIPAFMNLCTPDDVAYALPRLRPMNTQALADIITGPAAWHTVPSSYIVCTRDRAMSPVYQASRADILGDSVEFDADHSLFFSATERLVDRMLELAVRLQGQ